jgi:hypothetical protein
MSPGSSTAATAIGPVFAALVLSVAAAITSGQPAFGAGPSHARPLIYSAYYQPDSFDYAGHVAVYVRNPAKTPLTITRLTIDDQTAGRVWPTDRGFLEPGVREEYIEVANDQVAWYRVYPNPIPAGGMAEVIVRLVPEACEAERCSVGLHFAGHDPVSATVPLSASCSALDYVGISDNLREVHVYVRRQTRTRWTGGGVTTGPQPTWNPGSTRVEIDGRPVMAQVYRVFSRFIYAKVRLRRAWDYGSFHTVAVAMDSDRRAAMMRALPTPPPIGIMGNLSDPVAGEYASHLFDAHLAFVPGRDALYDTLERHGLRGAYIYYRKLRPEEEKHEPVYYDQAEAIGNHTERPSLWAYFLEDEPDGRYHVTELPALSIARDVERANQFCRIMDPQHPTYLQIDHGSFPKGVYLYGSVPDYICAHAYRVGTEQVVSATRSHVEHLRAGSRPRPFYYLNCGYSTNGTREFEPDEMRLEVFTALAGGAKSFQWYPAHGDRGLLEHPRMWRAVGEMNGVLHQVLPLTAIGTPVGRPRVEGGNVEGATILCGDDALVVVLVNRDFRAAPDSFSLVPARSVTVRAHMPRFMKALGVCTVAFPDETRPVLAAIHGSTVTFSADVEAGAALVVYADPSVPDRLRKIHARCLHRLERPAQTRAADRSG